MIYFRSNRYNHATQANARPAWEYVYNVGTITDMTFIVNEESMQQLMFMFLKQEHICGTLSLVLNTKS